MPFYSVKVYLDSIVCRDTESLNSSDKFALSGAVYTGTGDPGAFTLPIIRINTGETRPIEKLLFRGAAKQSKVALLFQAWDIDDNESWVENRDDINETVKQIAQGIKLIPKYGLIAGLVLDGAREVVINTIDKLVEWDKNDSLVDYHQLQDLPPSAPLVPAQKNIAIHAKKDDPTGYSDFDYTLNVTIESTQVPALWERVLTDADEAAATFRHRHDAAVKMGGFVGAFPTFFEAERGTGGGRYLVGGTVLLNAESAVWRDVLPKELRYADKRDFGERMRATQDYASRQGFIGGFPNFHERDGGVAFGTILLNHAHATWRDVPIAELRNVPLDNIRERFKATNEYATRNGFIGGYPNFYHAEYDGALRCGTILVSSGAGKWDDIYIRDILD